MQEMNVRWTGIRPLLMHNGRLADPLSDVAQKMKEVTGKRKKTDDDHLALSRLEWLGGMYYDDEIGPYVPAENIERAIVDGARMARKGKTVTACCFVDEVTARVPLDYDGPRDQEKLWKSSRFLLRAGIVVNKARVMRTRPMFPAGWSLSFRLLYEEDLIDPRDVRKAMDEAGSIVGLGDWRPKFGRFEVEIIEE